MVLSWAKVTSARRQITLHGLLICLPSSWPSLPVAPRDRSSGPSGIDPDMTDQTSGNPTPNDAAASTRRTNEDSVKDVEGIAANKYDGKVEQKTKSQGIDDVGKKRRVSFGVRPAADGNLDEETENAKERDEEDDARCLEAVDFKLKEFMYNFYVHLVAYAIFAFIVIATILTGYFFTS